MIEISTADDLIKSREKPVAKILKSFLIREDSKNYKRTLRLERERYGVTFFNQSADLPINRITRLSSTNIRVSIFPVASGRPREIGIAAYLGNKPSEKNNRNVRIKTRFSGIYINYHEVWKEETEFYRLKQAYLHVSTKDAAISQDDLNSSDNFEPNDFILIHFDPYIFSCDPNYISLLHYHTKFSKAPLDDFHLIARNGPPEIMMSDISALDLYMEIAVLTICSELERAKIQSSYEGLFL